MYAMLNVGTLSRMIMAWLIAGRLSNYEFTSREVIAIARVELDHSEFTLSRLNHALRKLVKTGSIALLQCGRGGERPARYYVVRR